MERGEKELPPKVRVGMARADQLVILFSRDDEVVPPYREGMIHGEDSSEMEILQMISVRSE